MNEKTPGPAAQTALDPAGELAAAVSDCVHCGFCLPACPTYQLWGEEMDSPRGRVHLIAQVLDGAPVTEQVREHFDRCLGCMACMPACPSGVRYNELIEAARTWTEEPQPGVTPGPPRSRRDRTVRAAIFATFPYPRRLRALTAPLRLAQRIGLDRKLAGSRALRRVGPELAGALRVAPRPGAGAGAGEPRQRLPYRVPADRWDRLPVHAPARRDKLRSRIPAAGPPRAVVGLLTGCVQQVFFPDVNAATARVLAAEGCEVLVPAGQGCCGALSLHSGRSREAARFAAAVVETFERAGVDAIVVNSAGCGSAMKEYGALLRHHALADRAAALSARVRDFSEFLAELYEREGGPRAARHELPVTAVYHDACHLAHAQRIQRQPRDLLRAIPGLTLVESGDTTCCGSAGVYNLLEPQAASELGQRKAAALRATGASLVVSGNPGCSLQIAATFAEDGGASPAVAHVAEVLDASIRGLPVSALTGCQPAPAARR
jgi:glycolate dehydrogenase iron-sulfur subunit